MAIKHYLNFISSGEGLLEIDEPIGFDAAQFSIEQDNGRLGRDVLAMTGGESKLRLSPDMNHYFEKVLYNLHFYGYELQIKHIIEIDETYFIIGDFDDLTTDQSTYIEFVVVEETEKALIKRRNDINTNLFSETTVDDGVIEPVTMQNVFLPAKPIIKVSKWNLAPFDYGDGSNEFAFNTNGVYFNPIQNQTQYDIKNSLTWLENFDTDNGDNFRVIEAQTNLKNVKIRFELDAIYKYRPNEFAPGLDHAGSFAIWVKHGQNYGAAVETEPIYYVGAPSAQYPNGNSNYDVPLPSVLEYTIPYVNNTDLVWVYFRVGSLNGAVNRIKFNEAKITITATSIAYNSFVPAVRLYDAMEYNVKSIAGLNIDAPRWNVEGEFYNQFITTQPLMRLLYDKPFNVSFKGITDKYLPEVNGDFQIQEDGTVFFGIEQDFYRNVEIGNYKPTEIYESDRIETGQIQEYSEDFNPRFNVNKFNYKYDNYQSQKENELDNTYDVVHGETQWYNQNKKVQNTKEVSVGFIRDPFLIEEARRKAFDLTDTAATQDDGKTYLFDIVAIGNNLSDRQFQETATLQHRYEDGILTLTNTQAFSWILLGIGATDQFIISSGANIGTYQITEVTDTALKLTLVTGDVPVNVDIENTTFTYFLRSDITLKLRTNEGFTIINNIAEGDNFGNLRFTVRRNIENYYQSYLATCNMYSVNKFKNSLYNNNPNALLVYEGVSTIEGSDIVPKGAILTPRLISVTIDMNLQEYLTLTSNLRAENGYITVTDSNGVNVKGYIQKAEWSYKSQGGGEAKDFVGEFKAVLEERYDPFKLSIFANTSDTVIVNGNLINNNFRFFVDDNGKFIIFEDTGKQLTVPVYFNQIQVNGSQQATSPQELSGWLSALQ